MAKGKKITDDVQRSADEQIDAAEKAKGGAATTEGVEGKIDEVFADKIAAERQRRLKERKRAEDTKVAVADDIQPELNVAFGLGHQRASEEALAIIDEYERASRDGRGLSRDDVVEMRRRVAGL